MRKVIATIELTLDPKVTDTDVENWKWHDLLDLYSDEEIKVSVVDSYDITGGDNESCI